MDSTEKFILSGNLNKSSKDENMSLNTVLSGNRKLLPDDGISDTMDLYEEYLLERKESNKFRLTININPYCTNVLFNPFTEIVKYDFDKDGKPKNTFLNFSIIDAVVDEEDYSVHIQNLEGRSETTPNGTPVIVDGAIGKKKTEEETDLKTFVLHINGDKNRFDDDGKFKWTAYDAIRDTQLSNDKCGFTYYCGLDIFNNHTLRNKTFKSVNYTAQSTDPISGYSKPYKSLGFDNIYVQDCYARSDNDAPPHVYVIPENFNTIDDYMRDKNGIIISDNILCRNNIEVYASPTHEYTVPMHLYQKFDVLSFENCVDEKLIERNGWFGFSNPSTFNSLSYNDDKEGGETVTTYFNISPARIYQSDCDTGLNKDVSLSIEERRIQNQVANTLSINKTINNKKYCDFIDMYPTRELFSFTPLYNETYKRYEKNWNYCLTYPSRSITEDFKGNKFPFFYYLPDGTVSLRTVMFDEYIVDDDGRDLITIYSVSQHGLKVKDTVNIYKGDELFYNRATVARIVDKYIFQIYKDSANISNKWINVDEIVWDNENKSTIEEITYDNTGEPITSTYEIENHGNYIKYKGKNYAIAESNRCNIDETAQIISFKRVVNNVECDYYVRVFSRLPNFKFADAEINDYNLYQDDKLKLIERYSKPTVDFENHISSMSFAQTYYGDETTEILYTDDIDISFLKDNLGRPLSEVELTIVKNNKGYKKWYKNEISGDDFEEIERSHCFGYISSGFLFNDSYRNFCEQYPNENFILKDVRDISVQENDGLRYHDRETETGYFDDELRFDEQTEYYGDICCYSSVECDETTLQNVMARFNTVQREMKYYDEFNPEETDLFKRYITYFNSYYDEDINPKGLLLHDEILYSDYDEKEGDKAEKMFEEFNEYIEQEDPTTKYGKYHSSFNYPDKKSYYYNDMLNFREGYYYKMHYKIPLKTISMSISSDEAIKYEIFSIEVVDKKLKIQTTEENYLSLNEKLTLYNKTSNKFYYLTVSEIFTNYYFECTVKNEDLSSGFEDSINFTDEVTLVKRNIGTPEYAKLIKDGSCRYYWRNIISNGIEENDSNVYPFTNGAFYINRQINFFLRRQDPNKENLAIPTGVQMDYVPEGEILPLEYYDNQYYDEEEIITC